RSTSGATERLMSPGVGTAWATPTAMTDAAYRAAAVIRRRSSTSTAVDDDPAGRIVRGQRHGHLVAENDADAVLAQLPPQVREHLVAVLELDLEVAGGQHLDDSALEFYVLFAAHEGSETYSVDPARSTLPPR